MYIFIINPSSGNGKATAFWQRMEQQLVNEEISYTKLVSTSEKETRQFLNHVLRAYQLQAVGVIGGDGTISSVIQVLANTSVPLAIFPAGSGNDTVRMFNLTNHPEQFIKRMLAAKTTCIDLLKLNGRYGITIAGIGIDTMIGEKVNNAFYKSIFNKLGIGSLSYLFAAIQAAFTFQPFSAKVTIDDKEHAFHQTWLIACGNTTSYGGGLTICPHANPTDGQFNMTMFHSLKRLKAISRIFPALLRGKSIHKPGITYALGKELSISTDRSMSAIIDGEMVTTTPIHIQIQPKALHLLLTT